MAIILGLDEAGYGPNIGPLVIACSLWRLNLKTSQPTSLKRKKSTTAIQANRVDRDFDSLVAAIESLCGALLPLFRPKPIDRDATFFPLGDSKKLYLRDNTFDSLAVGLRFWFDTIQQSFPNLNGLLDKVAPQCHSLLKQIDWYKDDLNDPESSLIQQANISSFTKPNESVQTAAQTHIDTIGLSFHGIQARIVDEGSFNEGVERLGNKSNVLSNITLSLATEVLNQAVEKGSRLAEDSEEPIFIYCDKHGGRNRYQAPLANAIPEVWFDIQQESGLRSDYRTIYHGHPLHWSFIAKGDSLFASAVASMMAKYLREMLMNRINHFWKNHIPDIAPTAGYPLDAKRFATAIEPFAARLGYSKNDWWRSR